MKFGLVSAANAEGTILAHSLQSGEGRIAKGTCLTAAQIALLRAAGHSELTVATLEEGDVHEDAAALELARALVSDSGAQGLRLSGAGAGRVNLYATGAGVLRLDPARIAGINTINPMITLATVPDYFRVDEGGMVATIKIISYAVPRRDLERVCQEAADAIWRARPVFTRATLIETRVAAALPPLKGREATAGRLARMGVALDERVVVAHREDDIATALGAAKGEVLFVLTGSATSDEQDVAPQGLNRAGGRLIRFGMPVDPGNLLFLGELSGKPVIGLPGCARSPALNGADWVLERVLCGIPVRSSDIAQMAIGGLLKEIPTRPMPRRSAGE